MNTLVPLRMLGLALALGTSFGLAACDRTSQDSAAASTPAASRPVADSGSRPAAAAPATPATLQASLPRMVVHKSPSCGCCGGWVEHMRAAGFTVDVRETDDLNAVKQRVGIPVGKGSCHTTEVGGYFIEGHVPATDIKRLLAERPDARGLALPGMPAGSPGMEMPDGRVDPYTVELVAHDGSTSAFASHPQ